MVEVSAQPSFPIYSILSIYPQLSQPHALRSSLIRSDLPGWAAFTSSFYTSLGNETSQDGGWVTQ